MTAFSVGRIAAAAVMSIVAVATVVGLTRAAAPAESSAMSSEAKLPGVAAVAPDVTAAPAPVVEPLLTDLLGQSDNDLWDSLLEDAAATASQTSSTNNSTDKSAASGGKSTTAPAPTTPAPAATTPAPAATTPPPAPAPTPTPTKTSNGLNDLLDGLFGKK